MSVVLRRYTMNNFGLWDSVVSKGHELLAGRMTVRFTTAAGEGGWMTGAWHCTVNKANRGSLHRR